jgi:hypothetical protein
MGRHPVNALTCLHYRGCYVPHNCRLGQVLAHGDRGDRVRCQSLTRMTLLSKHPQFEDPDANFSSAAFGVITSTSVRARIG